MMRKWSYSFAMGGFSGPPQAGLFYLSWKAPVPTAEEAQWAPQSVWTLSRTAKPLTSAGNRGTTRR